MGRPRKFEDEAVLGAAMALFREKGFGGTSVRDLEAATTLKAASLYNAFGNKNALFAAAMDHHCTIVVRDRIDRHLRPGLGLDGLRAFFASTYAPDPAAEHGCLLINTAVEYDGVDDVARAHLRSGLLEIRSSTSTPSSTARSFASRVDRNQKRRERHFDLCECARYLGFLYGQLVGHRGRVSPRAVPGLPHRRLRVQGSEHRNPRLRGTHRLYDATATADFGCQLRHSRIRLPSRFGVDPMEHGRRIRNGHQPRNQYRRVLEGWPLEVKDLAPIGSLGTRRYFGGLAVLVELTQFAMLMGDTLYFKVEDETRPAYEALGGKRFRYTTKRGEVTVRARYSAPAEILADPDRLCEWATQALATARASGRR